jgi:hypothetical protein
MSNWMEAKKHYSTTLKSLSHGTIEAHLAEAFKTNQQGIGTNITACLGGLVSFLTQHNLQAKAIRYQGPLQVETTSVDGLVSTSKQPCLKQLKQALQQHDPVMAIVGWYYYDAKNHVMQRSGSHAVSVVAIEQHPLLPWRQTLLVRDPNLKDRNPWGEDLLSRFPLKPITDQRLQLWCRKPTHETQHFPVSAKGFYSISKVFPMKPQGTKGILEGLVIVGGLRYEATEKGLLP